MKRIVLALLVTIVFSAHAMEDDNTYVFGTKISNAVYYDKIKKSIYGDYFLEGNCIVAQFTRRFHWGKHDINGELQTFSGVKSLATGTYEYSYSSGGRIVTAMEEKALEFCDRKIKDPAIIALLNEKIAEIEKEVIAQKDSQSSCIIS